MSRPVDFGTWYLAARGRKPLPWMSRLAQELAEGSWPDVLGLPTGTAKTEIIAVWVWALAVADAGVVPRRLWLASDRRVIADQGARVARDIAACLADAQAPPAVRAVALRLCALGGGDVALRPGLLRGGLALDDGELLDPLTPMAVATTVDQIGSRLLWRAYGAGPREWPLWAGLAGEDSAIVLDEAHLSAATEATIRQAHRFGAGIRFVSMTATPRASTGRVFTLNEADQAHPVLRQRLQARRLVSLRKAADVAETMVATAEEMLAGGARRVAVICNTVRRARDVFARLSAEPAEPFLLIGRSRPLDREAMMQRLEPRIASGAEPSAPLIVVSTQCIEAGADFDFDAMVSEACPLDALRQRLGRLDRLGEAGESRCVLAAPASIEDVPPYGAATAAAWAWLEKVAGKTREVDLGIEGWERLAVQALPPSGEANTLHPATVTFLEPHLRLLTRTWPRPGVEPNIDLLLHGLGHRGGDVSLIWREDVDVDDLETSEEILSLLPPTALEAVQVPIWEVQRWLTGGSLKLDAGDVEGATAPEEDRVVARDSRILRWCGSEDDMELVQARDLRAGDILVVPADRGGCDAWGWAPDMATATVRDLGDEAWTRKRGYPVRRVHLEPGQDLEDLRRQEVGPGQRVWLWAGGLVVEELPSGRGSIRGGCEVLLDAHTGHVEVKAHAFAELLGISSSDFALAARWHDVGKADPRWQIMIRGGDIARLGEPLLAKGNRYDPRREADGRQLARLPIGWRHEAESLRRLETSGELNDADDPDLVRWLVATHHGYARPWWPVVDGAPPDPGLAGLMARLGGRLGWWRLAWLEAVFRQADRVASREEEANA